MFKLTLSGISAQIAAVVMVLHAGNSLALLLSCLLLQGTAAALIGPRGVCCRSTTACRSSGRMATWWRCASSCRWPAAC
jgi:hypothetical protein